MVRRNRRVARVVRNVYRAADVRRDRPVRKVVGAGIVRRVSQRVAKDRRQVRAVRGGRERRLEHERPPAGVPRREVDGGAAAHRHAPEHDVFVADLPRNLLVYILRGVEAALFAARPGHRAVAGVVEADDAHAGLLRDPFHQRCERLDVAGVAVAEKDGRAAAGVEFYGCGEVGVDGGVEEIAVDKCVGRPNKGADALEPRNPLFCHNQNMVY